MILTYSANCYLNWLNAGGEWAGEDIPFTEGISITLYPGQLMVLTQTTITPTDALAVRQELPGKEASQTTEQT